MPEVWNFEHKYIQEEYDYSGNRDLKYEDNLRYEDNLKCENNIKQAGAELCQAQQSLSYLLAGS